MIVERENPYGVFVRANACFLLLRGSPYGAYHNVCDMRTFVLCVMWSERMASVPPNQTTQRTANLPTPHLP